MTILKLDLNERSETPPNWATKALAELPLDSLWRYQDRQMLEHQIASLFHLPPEQVLLTNGGDEAIQTLFASLPPKTAVILPKPIFGFYLTQAAIWPVNALKIPAQPGFTIDIPAVERTIREHPGALCILTRPNNPTGEVIDRQAVLDLLAASTSNGGSLLLDEAYAAFFNDPMVDLLASHPNLIILRTFSKACGLAGLRLGYLLGAPDSLQPLRERILPFNIAAPSLFIGQRAIGSEAQTDIRNYADAVAANRDRILAVLRDWHIETTPSQANFIFLRLGEKRANFVRLALEKLGFAVRHFRRAALAGCLRIAIPAESRALESALALVLRPQLLCLDVDGTLIDTRKSFDAMVVELVTETTGRVPTCEEIHAVRARGGFNDDFALAAELTRAFGKASDYKTMAEKGSALYFGEAGRPGLCRLEAPLYKSGLIRGLAAKCHLALVTGRSQTELAVATDLLERLEHAPAITIDDVTAGKPDPEGIRLAASRTHSHRVWMIGDNPDDMVAAREAGALAIGIGPHGSMLKSAGAVMVLEDINDLEVLL